MGGVFLAGQEHAEHGAGCVENGGAGISGQGGGGEADEVRLAVQALGFCEVAEGHDRGGKRLAIGIAGKCHVGVRARHGGFKGGDPARGQRGGGLQEGDAQLVVAEGERGVMAAIERDAGAAIEHLGGGQHRAVG